MDADREQKLRELFDGDDNTAAYVMIRCSLPEEDGRMDVDMIHGGDNFLTLYLLENAQERLQAQLEEMEDNSNLAMPD